MTTDGDTALRERMLAWLHAHNVMTLATAEPWAAALFYANDGFTLYFVSMPQSRHCDWLARDPRVAATVQEDERDWRAIKGIQLEGVVGEVPQPDIARVRRLYADKFPFVGAGAAVEIARALDRVRWYRVEPARVCFVDNAAGFGRRACIDVR